MSWQKGVAEAVAAKANSTTANATGKGDENWIHIQKKTFTNWVNTQLAEVGAKVEVLEEDLKSGVNLIQTLEVCSKKSLGRYTKLPKIPTHALENLTLALKFLEKEGLKLVNIGPQDIHAGNLKLILGLIWTIIYHFQVSKSFKEAAASGAKKGTAKDLLLEWVRATIPEYNIKNFNSDWNDGRALCALVNAVGGEPWLMPNHNQLLPGAGARNCKAGIDAAYDNFGIPRLIAPEDMADPAVDDLSMVTYISYFRDAKRGGKGKDDGSGANAAAAAAPAPEPTPPPQQRLQGPAERKASASAAPAKLPPPWERAADWRKYEGPDLGGRCKIRVFYSSTTSSHEIRKNTKALMDLLERENVHKRPDFEPWIPIDVDMPTEKRNAIFDKAKTKVTPMLFIDDEYIGDWKKVEALNESGELHRLLEY